MSFSVAAVDVENEERVLICPDPDTARAVLEGCKSDPEIVAASLLAWDGLHEPEEVEAWAR